MFSRQGYTYARDQIRDADATLIVAQLLFLEAEATSKPIHLYINSPGGSVTAGLSIYDTYVTQKSYSHDSDAIV